MSEGRMGGIAMHSGLGETVLLYYLTIGQIARGNGMRMIRFLVINFVSEKSALLSNGRYSWLRLFKNNMSCRLIASNNILANNI